MIWAEEAKRYLAAFAAKDIDTLERMYSDNVEMTIGGASLLGKEEVLAGNRSVFKSINSFSIRIQNTCYRDKFICLEYLILVDDGGANLVSIVEFNSFGKIKSIRTYKQ